MPQELIVIFLLFFAVLAFGWFYWQRAKARDAGTTVTETRAEPEPGAPVTHEATAADQPADRTTSGRAS